MRAGVKLFEGWLRDVVGKCRGIDGEGIPRPKWPSGRESNARFCKRGTKSVQLRQLLRSAVPPMSRISKPRTVFGMRPIHRSALERHSFCFQVIWAAPFRGHSVGMDRLLDRIFFSFSPVFLWPLGKSNSSSEIEVWTRL